MKNSNQPLAIVLVSSGMHSCVTTAIANQNYKLTFLHLNYGRRTEKRELKAFNDIADFYDVQHRFVVNVELLKLIGGSSLTDEKLPVELADLERKGIPGIYI